MSKVLVVGHVPLPFENLKKFYAPGARTWHFSEPLIADGHELVIAGLRIPFVYDDDLPDVVKTEERGCTIYSVTPAAAECGTLLTDLAEEFEPDCVLGVNSYPSYVACVKGLEQPLWADINGCLLAEAQLKAATYSDDAFLEHFFRMDEGVLRRADRFSTVALRQKYELIGELAHAGRLTSSTAGYDFVADIPNAYPDTPLREEGARELRARTEGDFLVLWSGGYNTWTDTSTLFEGLTYAMERNPRVKYVSTGGSIDGHDELTYPTLVKLVEESPLRDNFLLEGWIERDVARSYYLSCDVGVNIDSDTYEVMFGSRNRIMDWAVAALPSLSTDLCELTEEFAAQGLLYRFPDGDPVALGQKILELAADPEGLARTGERLKKYVFEKFSYAATTGALREWVASPEHSPDWEERKDRILPQPPPPPPPPPITPASSAGEKLKFYLKNEGVGTTVKRAASSAKRKTRRGGESQ